MAQHQRPAAAVEEHRAAWSDALDVDDSDLRHNPPSSLPLRLLRPCTSSHPRAPHHSRVPGPASSVQDAISLGFPVSSGPDPAARVGDQAAEASDFPLDPLLCALRFLGEDRARQRTGIGAIRGERALYRAPLVVGMVTLCMPNGLGDLFLNLKDPTGTIGASVHKKVITDGNLGNGISVGSVIVLKQVSVFRPSRTACYLNVTQQNVVKVLPEDSASPSNQNLNIANTRCSQPSLGGSSVMSVYGDCTQATANEKLRRLFDGEWMVPSSKKLKSDAIIPDDNDARTNINSSNGLENNLNIGLDDMADGFQSEHTSRKLSEHQQKDFDAANAGTVQPTQLNCCTTVTNATAISGSLLSNPKKLVSVASVAEWTDEQLAELFVDY